MKKYKALLVNQSKLKESFIEDLISVLVGVTKENILLRKGHHTRTSEIMKQLNFNDTQIALIDKIEHIIFYRGGLKDVVIMLNSFNKGVKRLKTCGKSDYVHERQYNHTDKDGNFKLSHSGNLPNGHFRWNSGNRYIVSEEDLRKITLFIKPLIKYL